MAKETDPAAISFIEPPPAEPEIPEQKQFYQLPTRFGSVPIDEAPLGWEVETRRRETKITKFEHAYPRITLPFQEVQRVEFGHGRQFSQTPVFPTAANRLFFGDCLHVMRQLPSNSIDLIYIDPPFFSGRNYNVLFGDKNEVRSFSDIWEGGMPGYLVWLNARLYEMKRLLKPTGSIFVHVDWHAVHYVKVEMDKIFGYNCFQTEIVWRYRRWPAKTKNLQRMHDTILYYVRKADDHHVFNLMHEPLAASTLKTFGTKKQVADFSSGHRKPAQLDEETPGAPLSDVWEISVIAPIGKERIGYPTQKPEALIERMLQIASNEGDTVADFFCGGGTTPAVAQRMNRRWIACDQSRIAVAIISDRVARTVEEKVGKLFPAPDFTVENWGIYEIPRLEALSESAFREFVVRAFGGKPESVSQDIHGMRHGVPLYVCHPSRKERVDKDDVGRFAKAIFEERRTNAGTMLAWNFGPDAKKAAEILAARENRRIDFVRLALVRLESDEFREHVISKHTNYGERLSFIQPPEIVVHVRRTGHLKYEFDVSESASMNKDGMIANVQWDFDYRGKFTSTQGYAFLRDTKTGQPSLLAEYEFPRGGESVIACSVQDDQGGERTAVVKVEVK